MLLNSTRRSRLLGAAATLVLGLAVPGLAHDSTESDGQMHNNIHLHGGGEDGHVPADVNYGFKLEGEDTL